MRCLVVFVSAVVGFLVSVAADQASSDSKQRTLIIDRCSTTVSGARATLSIGPLRPKAEIYAGDYQVKVLPYFFKGEKGTLALNITTESIANAVKGRVVDVTGTATENGARGKVRRIDARATPLDSTQGNLRLWFLADDDTKMVFETRYHFAAD